MHTALMAKFMNLFNELKLNNNNENALLSRK